MLKLFFLLMLWTLSGCDLFTHQELNTALGSFKSVYKPVLSMTVNGKKYTGVAVVSKADKYVIKIDAENDLDTLWFTSCHRSYEFHDNGDSFEYTYTPVRGIEDRSSCSLDIEGYNKDLKHSWGMIVIADTAFTVASILECSGVVSHHAGVSACASLPGQKERISFSDDKVKFVGYKSGDCKMEVVKSGTAFYFWPPAARCAHVFKSETGAHLLYTIGYRRQVREK